MSCVLCPWKPGSVMTQSERSERASRNLLLFQGSAVIPTVSQWQQHPTMALWHVLLLPLPSYSLKSPGDLIFFLFLEATKLDSRTSQGTLVCPMHGAVCCHTPNVPVIQKLRLRDRSKYLNGRGKKTHKETADQDFPSAHSHHLMAEIDLLCSCFTPGKVEPCFLTSMPDGSLRRTCSSWQGNKWHQVRSGLKSHSLLLLR